MAETMCPRHHAVNRLQPMPIYGASISYCDMQVTNSFITSLKLSDTFPYPANVRINLTLPITIESIGYISAADSIIYVYLHSY